MSRELRGAPVAKALGEATASRARTLADAGVAPRLALVRVGDDPGSLWYQGAAVRRCRGCGIEATAVELAASTSQRELEEAVRLLADAPDVHGILVLRPLPPHLDESPVLEAIPAEKDVDGASVASMGALFAGDRRAFAPCTAEAVIALLDHYGCELSGREACVVGRSCVVGRPVAALLQARDATVTVCHTRTPDPAALCRRAGLVVAAAGRPGLVRGSWVADGAWVVDVGTSEDEDGRLAGDVDQASLEGRAVWLTPVPGGVGAVTTAVLARHVVTAAERQARAEGLLL